MTAQEKKEWQRQIISFVLAVLASLILFSFTILRENRVNVNGKIQELDIKKVDKTEFDSKCKEIKDDQIKSEDRISKRLDNMEKNIIDIIKEQR